jgi:hypothetical protein
VKEICHKGKVKCRMKAYLAHVAYYITDHGKSARLEFHFILFERLAVHLKPDFNGANGGHVASAREGKAGGSGTVEYGKR